MMRSMYSGVAGLRTHQTRMDVIGNNIANVNTVGYKSQSALFAELLYQNSSAASGPNDETKRGGINPKQVGLGTKMASISTNITLPGSMETTNNPFDVCITGDSFFIVNDGRSNFFTRDGSFKVDAAGNLVLSSNGYQVMGWQLDETTGDIKKDTVSALRIMSAANMTYPPEATTQAYVSGIVDKDSPELQSDDGKLMNLNFFDSRGYSYTAKLAIKPAAAATGDHNTYSCELVSLLDSNGKEMMLDENGNKLDIASLGTNQVVRYPNNEIKGLGVTGGSVLRKAGANFIIEPDTPPTNIPFTRYTITASGISAATVVSDGTNETATVIDDQAAIDKGLAESFGKTADEFSSLVAEVVIKDNTGATTSTTTYDIPGQLYQYLDATQGKAADGGNLGMTADGNGSTAGIVGTRMDGVTISFDKGNGSFVGLNVSNDPNSVGVTSAVLSFSDAYPNFEDITIDFSTLSNVSNEKVSTAAATNGSLDNKGGGRKLGKMSGLAIQQDGKIYASYDNGQSKLLGQIAAALFANPSGLQKEGDNLYSATQNSGEFDGIGVDITSDGGYMTSGELEMSNVDLSNELTGMIVTQRGFQANSRIITVSDTMLEELINLKR